MTMEQLREMEGQKVLIYRMKSTEPPEPGTVMKNGDSAVMINNADRIRAMSDEELADMFAEFAEENPSDDANAWYEWLTKPAEVE